MTVDARLERIEQLVLLGAKSVLNTNECALLLGISESRVRHLAQERNIPHYRQGAKLYFKKSEIEQWQTQTRIPTMAEMESRGTTYAVTNPKF